MNMKILIWIIIAIAITPVIDGLVTKHLIMQRVESLAPFMAKNGSKITVAEYNMGWISSSIVFSIEKPGSDSAPVLSPPITIHHGPIVFVNNKPVFALASVNYDLKFPPEFMVYIHSSSDYLLRYNAILTLNSIKDNMIVADMTITDSTLGWGGMSIVDEMKFTDNVLANLKSRILIGYISLMSLPGIMTLPTIKTDTMTLDLNGNPVPGGAWVGDVNLTSPNISAEWNGVSQAINDLVFHFSSNIENNFSNLNYKLTASSIDLGSAKLPVNSLKNLSCELQMKNLSKDFITNWQDDDEEQSDANSQQSGFIKMLSSSSTISLLASADTNLGSIKGEVNTSLQSLPKNILEFNKEVNITGKIRMPGPLVEGLITQYISDLESKFRRQQAAGYVPPSLSTDAYGQPLAMNPAPAPVAEYPDPAQLAKLLIAKLLQDGYLTLDKDGYTLTITKTGETILVNGKDISNILMSPDGMDKYLESVGLKPLQAAPAPQMVPAATSAPAMSAPAMSAPAMNAPAMSAPAMNAPAMNAPATNAPAMNAPATNAPAMNPPATNAPAMNPPVAPAPAKPVPVQSAMPSSPISR